MRKLAGNLVIILGVLTFVWSLFVPGSFAFVAARGFVGTQGREAGDELLAALMVLVLGCVAGYFLIRAGARLLINMVEK